MGRKVLKYNRNCMANRARRRIQRAQQRGETRREVREAFKELDRFKPRKPNGNDRGGGEIVLEPTVATDTERYTGFNIHGSYDEPVFIANPVGWGELQWVTEETLRTFINDMVLCRPTDPSIIK